MRICILQHCCKMASSVEHIRSIVTASNRRRHKAGVWKRWVINTLVIFGLCIHLNKTEVAGETWLLHLVTLNLIKIRDYKLSWIFS